MWTDKTRAVFSVRDKATYSWVRSSYNQDSVYNIRFWDFGVGYNYNWTADKTIGDTLVFIDNSRVGSSYYLTRK